MDGKGEWPQELTREFIRLYRISPCLWRSSSPDYKHRASRDEAHESLLGLTRRYFLDADLNFVRRKINILRTMFRKEHNKVLRLAHRGQAYKPKLWCYEELRFLAETVTDPYDDSAKNLTSKCESGEPKWNVKECEDAWVPVKFIKVDPDENSSSWSGVNQSSDPPRTYDVERLSQFAVSISDPSHKSGVTTVVLSSPREGGEKLSDPKQKRFSPYVGPNTFSLSKECSGTSDKQYPSQVLFTKKMGDNNQVYVSNARSSWFPADSPQLLTSANECFSHESLASAATMTCQNEPSKEAAARKTPGTNVDSHSRALERHGNFPTWRDPSVQLVSGGPRDLDLREDYSGVSLQVLTSTPEASRNVTRDPSEAFRTNPTALCVEHIANKSSRPVNASLLNVTDSCRTEETEDEIFARMVAFELRNILDSRQKLFVKKMINDALFQGQVDGLNLSSRIVTSDQTLPDSSQHGSIHS